MNNNQSKLSKNQKRKLRLAKKVKNQQLVVYSEPSPARQANINAVSAGKQRRNSRSKRRNSGVSLSGGRRLGKSSMIPYEVALQNPEDSEGCKIPDIIAYPTGTFQLTTSFDLAIGTSGDAYGCMFQPIIGDGSTTFPVKAMNGTSTFSLSTVTNYSWAARSAISGLYSLYRPVSASVEMFWMGIEANRGGEVSAGTTWVSSLTPPTTYTGVATLPDMEFFPMDKGVRVLWKPLDNSHLSFYSVNGPDNSIGAPYYPSIFIAALGILQTGSTCHVTVTCNFEAIPNSRTSNLVETEPSPYNAASLRRAFEWASQAGNAAMPLLHDAIDFASQAYRVGNLAYNALPQRTRRSIRSATVGSITSLAAHTAGQMKQLTHNEGKEEENVDNSVQEALEKFEQLNIEFERVITKPEKPSASPSLRIGTPQGSPIALRRVGGQV